MTDDTYNGWKNYETWNVALWIGNDEGLYETAKEARDLAEWGGLDGYKRFVALVRGGVVDELQNLSEICYQTPDNVAWNDSGLDIPALDEMIAEL